METLTSPAPKQEVKPAATGAAAVAEKPAAVQAKLAQKESPKVPDVQPQTIELHVRALDVDARLRFDRDFASFKQRVPEALRPLLLGPVTPPGGGDSVVVLIHDGSLSGSEADRQWRVVASDLIEQARFFQSWTAVTTHYLQSAPAVKRLYQHHGEFFLDAAWTKKVSDIKAFLEKK